MSQGNSSGGIEADSVLNTSTVGADVIYHHLERALENAENSTTRYHIRQTLQLLENRSVP